MVENVIIARSPSLYKPGSGSVVLGTVVIRGKTAQSGLFRDNGVAQGLKGKEGQERVFLSKLLGVSSCQKSLLSIHHRRFSYFDFLDSRQTQQAGIINYYQPLLGYEYI